ncbi:Z-ring associated protein ZapG [secondary endosymbiont of Ctenarytaina eucalypti]|uniref:Z-ring associated protein G n=1 Tax=secondary endosymbiont of Ctenarytaina eucalypti TaxID=1199245 RepID=J3VT58_9ENTR|nr:Z-ring associated protein ZapG [secondary endosymbiont of Ctenarytaina eucalypti]AFP85151.1 hypothetical protein A359_07820 [secondary endosymbiont of Ctenarytaina eucalypti]
MTWQYMLLGVLMGIFIGTVAMRFGNRKVRQQKTLQHELDKSKAELNKYREELTTHFARSAELLDNIADDCRQLYKHISQSSNSLLPNRCQEENPFRYRLTEAEADNDQIPPEMQPPDCPENKSSSRRSLRGLRK